MILLDGKLVSEDLKKSIADQAAIFLKENERKPHLAAILVGNDGGSETYVASKVKNCEKVGFESTLIRFDTSVSEIELLNEIRIINERTDIDGLIVQLPLPAHINPDLVTETIDYRKDVDGFHPVNLGRMQRNLPCFLPATPFGILLMLEYYKINTSGMNCVVIGRSNIVGSPISILMARNANPGNCTVTLAHSKTKNVKELTLNADIIIAAIGKKNFLSADMVKNGSIIIDVGINREESSESRSGYKLFGDVDFEQVSKKAAFITPVPGGVGLMTIVGLLKNTLSAARKEIYS